MMRHSNADTEFLVMTNQEKDLGSFVVLLKACGRKKDLCEATRLHEEVVKRGLLEKNPRIGSALICTYAECGMTSKSRGVFEDLPIRDVVTWNSLISCYTRRGQGHEALKCFGLMQKEGFRPTEVTFLCMLNACGNVRDIDTGEQIHDEIVTRGLFEKNLMLGNALVDMYARCGMLRKAREVLEHLPIRDVVSWNSLIAGYTRLGRGHEALDSFDRMRSEGISPDAVTFSSTLRACGTMRSIHKGKMIHDEIVHRGLLNGNIVLGNALVDMYVKCGVLAKAQHVFDDLPVRDVISWNALIAGYAQNGQSHEAFYCFEKMQTEGLSPDAITFSCILTACGNIGAIDKANQIHDEILTRRLLEKNIVLGNGMVDMYVRCGYLGKARDVLNKLPHRDVISWTTLISGYATHSQVHEALSCLQQMQKDGISPNEVTYLYILKVCGSTETIHIGKKIHDDILRKGSLKKNIALWKALVAMYAHNGLFLKAREVLEEIPIRDVVTWNALITGYTQVGKGHEAMNCFELMQMEGINPDASTLSCILKACGSTKYLGKGEEIHKEIIRRGLLENDAVVGTALVDMYAACGALMTAHKVLDELPTREVSSWNALIAGYSEHGQCDKALACFEWMKSEGCSPDSITFTSILKACSNIRCIELGRQIHDEMLSKGLLVKDIVLCSALIDMYAQCGVLEKAQQVHDELPLRDVVSWTALIAGYVEHGQGHAALNCLENMQIEGLLPNEVTFISIFKACGITGAIDKGERILDEVVSMGFLLKENNMLGNALVDMYAKCGALEKAQKALDEFCIQDVASWTALIAGYVEEGSNHKALNCFERMQTEGICPNAITYSLILKACSNIGVIDKGMKIHDDIVNNRHCVIEKNVMLGTALIGMYAKCGMLAKAQEVHHGILCRDVISWSTLISAYAQHERGHEALHCFEQMKSEGVSPNEVIFTCILKACRSIGAIDKAKQVHDEIVEKGLLKKDGILGTALVDMYVKCGLLAKAQEVHDEIRTRDIVAWNTLIGGYAQCGYNHEVAKCFEQMQTEHLFPDAITFLCLLNACSYLGRLNEAQMYFSSMTGSYGISPNSEHYTCMIVAFGNAGHFDKVISMIKMMPTSDDPVVWLALANASKRWGNVKLGRLAFDQIALLERSPN